jgi:hypothetical protein
MNASLHPIIPELTEAVTEFWKELPAQRGLRPQPKSQISYSRSGGENDSSEGKSLRAAKKFTNSIAEAAPSAFQLTCGLP